MTTPREPDDLDALILRAEHAVIQHDRQLHAQVDELAQDLREHAGRLTLLVMGAVSAVLLLSWLIGRSRDRGDRDDRDDPI